MEEIDEEENLRGKGSRNDGRKEILMMEARNRRDSIAYLQLACTVLLLSMGRTHCQEGRPSGRQAGWKTAQGWMIPPMTGFGVCTVYVSEQGNEQRKPKSEPDPEQMKRKPFRDGITYSCQAENLIVSNVQNSGPST